VGVEDRVGELALPRQPLLEDIGNQGFDLSGQPTGFTAPATKVRRQGGGNGVAQEAGAQPIDGRSMEAEKLEPHARLVGVAWGPRRAHEGLGRP
jgi:hypothetical protein